MRNKIIALLLTISLTFTSSAVGANNAKAYDGPVAVYTAEYEDDKAENIVNVVKEKKERDENKKRAIEKRKKAKERAKKRAEQKKKKIKEIKEIPVIKNFNYYSNLIYTAAEARGLDPTRAVAISRLESGNFTSNAFIYGNNFGGLTGSCGVMSFSSEQEGLNAYLNTLEHYRGMDLYTMSTIYCPPRHDHWYGKVSALQNEVNSYFGGHVWN